MEYPYCFRIDEWQSRINLQSLRKENEFFDIGSIGGPVDIVVVEQCRAELRGTIDLGQPVTSDVFVFAAGEPTIPYATKIGGTPYRPKASPWPLSQYRPRSEGDLQDGGRPMTFVSQLCFAGSEDITGPLPGKVLLIFSDDLTLGHPNALHFEWQTPDIGDLVVEDEIPVGGRLNCDPAYGLIYRTADLPEASGKIRLEFRIDRHAAIMDATKIGGVPAWIQFRRQMTGRYLATLCSLEPSYRKAHPLVNVDRLDRAAAKRKRLELGGDSGHVHLFVSDDGTVSWTFECY